MGGMDGWEGEEGVIQNTQFGAVYIAFSPDLSTMKTSSRGRNGRHKRGNIAPHYSLNIEPSSASILPRRKKGGVFSFNAGFDNHF
jgi:hypothetical protein